MDACVSMYVHMLNAVNVFLPYIQQTAETPYSPCFNFSLKAPRPSHTPRRGRLRAGQRGGIGCGGRAEPGGPHPCPRPRAQPPARAMAEVRPMSPPKRHFALPAFQKSKKRTDPRVKKPCNEILVRFVHKPTVSLLDSTVNDTRPDRIPRRCIPVLHS